MRHARPHHVEAGLDHGRVEARPTRGPLTLTREPLDLASLGDRLPRVRPVHELIADQVRYPRALPDLTAEQMIELEPDEGERLRKLTVAVTRAAKEVNTAMCYGASESGALLVWLEARPRQTRRSRRGRTATSA